MASSTPPANKTPGLIAAVISPSCQEHIKWIKTVFGAEQREIYMSEDGKRVMHAVLMINDGFLYISDSMACSMEEEEKASPKLVEYRDFSGFVLNLEIGGEPVELWEKALAQGAQAMVEMKVQECGALYGCFKDPFGMAWGVLKIDSASGSDEHQPGVVPFIINVENPEEQVQWVVSSLGGVIKEKVTSEEGKFRHAIMEVNGTKLIIANCPDHPFSSSSNGNNKNTTNKKERFRLMCHLQLPNPHTTWDKMLQNGATVTIDLKIQFWGDLYGAASDMTGLEWSLSKLTPDQGKSKFDGGVIPYIISTDCDRHVEWMQKVFGGEMKQVIRTNVSRKIKHCHMVVNKGNIFLCDKSCESPPNESPPNSKETSPPPSPPAIAREGGEVLLQVSLADPDTVWKAAMSNGAVVLQELKQQYWGGYFGCLRDPLGVQWGIMKACGQ